MSTIDLKAMVLNFLTYPDQETKDFIKQCLENITFCETSLDTIEVAVGKGERTYLAGTIFYYAPEFLYEPRYFQVCSIISEISIWFKLFQPLADANSYSGQDVFNSTLAYDILKKVRTDNSYHLTSSLDTAVWSYLLGCYAFHHECYNFAKYLSDTYAPNITLNQAKLYDLQERSYLHQTKCSHYEVPILSSVVDILEPDSFAWFYKQLPMLTPTKFHTYLRLYCLEEQTLVSKSRIELVDEDIYQVCVAYTGHPSVLNLQHKDSTISMLYFDGSTNTILLKSNPKTKAFIRRTKVIRELV